MYESKCFVYQNISIIYTFFICAFSEHNSLYLTLLISKELKIKYKAFLLKKCLVSNNTPFFFCNFVFIVFMCLDHFKFLSIIVPKLNTFFTRQDILYAHIFSRLSPMILLMFFFVNALINI